jgi:LacI family transcriptional regulator
MKKRVSQRDIARILGVNASTVSRALKGQGGVSPALQEQIVRLANDQNYRPNPFAMSLRYDTTRTIGVIIPDISFSYYAHIVKRIEADARENGYMCIITDSGNTLEGEKECLEHLENMHVEGIIMCFSQETDNVLHLQQLKNSRIPIVLFDRVLDCDISTVVNNDTASAREATLHLIDGGARRIAFLGGPNVMKQTYDRKHGYLEALRERGIAIEKELVRCHSLNFNSGLSDTLELLGMDHPPDAILATHGLLSIAAFQAIISRKLNIPEDIAIIGFMSEWVSGLSTPRMTFVKQNTKEIGRNAFKVLLEQMNGNDNVQHIIVKTRLEERESTRKIGP